MIDRRRARRGELIFFALEAVFFVVMMLIVGLLENVYLGVAACACAIAYALAWKEHERFASIRRQHDLDAEAREETKL